MAVLARAAPRRPAAGTESLTTAGTPGATAPTFTTFPPLDLARTWVAGGLCDDLAGVGPAGSSVLTGRRGPADNFLRTLRCAAVGVEAKVG